MDKFDMQYPRIDGRKRYMMAVMCLFVTIICYADRTNIGIAAPAFLDSKDKQGFVLSSFFYGYLATQVLGGFFATKIGAKKVLLTGVIVWTVFDVSTVLVSKCLGCLFFVRACMGLGEGILFPCMHQLSAAWYPKQERSRLVAFVSSGSDLGTIVALIFSPKIMEYAGWQKIFLFFGCLSLIWIVVFLHFGASLPEEDPTITEQEKRYILENRTTTTRTHKSTTNTHFQWRILLTSRAAWAIYVAHFCNNYGWYVLLGWIPQYFRQVLKIDLGKHGISAATPYICGYGGVLLFGKLSDYLIAKGYRTLHVRQTMNGLSFFGSAFFLYVLRYATSASMAVGFLSLTLFLGRASTTGYWINMIDIGPNHAGHVMGISNTIATIPGIVGNVITGKILEATGDWDFVFMIASAILIFGGIFFHCNASDKSIYRRHANIPRIHLTPNSFDHDQEDKDAAAAADDDDDQDHVNQETALLSPKNF